MTMQSSGPYCDICGKIITGINGGTMDTWLMPCGLTIVNHSPKCRAKAAEFKAAACQAFAEDLLSWLRFLMSGQTATWDEIDQSTSEAVSAALAKARG